MYRFDQEGLTARLQSLPQSARVAFALACAERLSAFIGEPHELAGAARNAALRFMAGEASSSDFADLAAQLEQCPQIDRDDVAASAHLLDCIRNDDLQAAVWVAQRAYEARDLAAQGEMRFVVYTPEIEAALLSHPAVQAELATQSADIAALFGERSRAGR
jgi:hypothetical protein